MSGPTVVPFLALVELSEEEENCFQVAHQRYLDAGITWHMTGWSDGAVHIQVLDATREHAAASLVVYLTCTDEGAAYAAATALTLPDDHGQQIEAVMQWICVNLALQQQEVETVMLQAWQFLEVVEKHFFAKWAYEQSS